MLCSRVLGIARTVRLIRFLAAKWMISDGSLDDYSTHFENIFARWRPWFFARRQKCLIRGLFLFFCGKRLGSEVSLIFGTKKNDNDFHWHCWIREAGILKFERPEVIDEYVVFLEYS